MIELAVAMSFTAVLLNVWGQYKTYRFEQEWEILLGLEFIKTENFKQDMIDNKEEYGELIERLIEASLKK